MQIAIYVHVSGVIYTSGQLLYTEATIVHSTTKIEEHCGARLIELLYECGESDGAWTHTLLLRDTTLMHELAI